MRTHNKLHIPGVGFRLGDRVKDAISGFKGLVTSHSRHLTGCDTVWLTSETETCNGQPVERCFDVLSIELVDSNPLDIQSFPENVEPAG